MKPVLETKSTYKGYPYVVLFMPGAYRCGYVGVPYNHKLAKKYVDKLSHLKCHGGVLTQNHIYMNAMMTIHGGLDLIVLIALMGMMLMQQNSILEMTQVSKDCFIQWKISGENQIMIPKIKSAHLLMSKMSARNLLTRLKRSDFNWWITNE